MSLDGLDVRWSFEPVRNSLHIQVTHAEEREAPGVSFQYAKSGQLQAHRGPTVNEMFDSFMKERQHYKASTIRCYVETWRYVTELFGTRAAADIQAHEIAVFRSEMASKYAPRTVNRIVGLLRNVMMFGFRRGLTVHNPALDINAVREELSDLDPFTLDEVQAVFLSLRARYRAYFVVSLWTGARPCELQALRWKDISFETNELHVSKARVRGKEGTPKTRRSRRSIPLFPPALQALREQLEFTGSDVHNYVFVTRAGDPITKHMDGIWKNACRRAGVRHRPPYQLRHTFASLMLSAGEAPAYVARLLGHTTVETLYRYYARWIPNATSTDGSRFMQNVVGRLPQSSSSASSSSPSTSS